MKFFIFLLIIFSFSCFAQVWTYDSDFVETTSPHGIVVTPDGKIWIGTYGATDSILVNGVWQPVNSIRIYNPDGTLHHLIQMLTYNGVTDTLWNTCRGMSLDNNGNVLYSYWYTMYRINYQTYDAMNKQDPFAGNSITKMACDDNGYIYIHRVVASGIPLSIFDSDFDLYNEVDSSWAISRALEVSGDGNDIFLGVIYGGSRGNGIIHYQSDNGNGPHGTYTAIDTLWPQIWAGQSLDWDNNGLLWAGSYWDIGVNDWGGWYGIDVSQNFAIVDTLRHFIGPRPGWDPVDGLPYFLSPRGAAWSNNNEYMYTCDFDGNMVKKWRNRYSKIDEDNSYKLSTFELKNNYPNPFNPNTKIAFEIKKIAVVKLEILDMLGRHVQTLLKDLLQPKTYEIEFDGSQLPSGTYFYRLTADGFIKTGKMQLIK